jgi:hypothetical protein
MPRILFVFLSLMAFCWSAGAQEERKKSAAYLDAQNIVLQARQQQRRDILREALKVPVEEAPVPLRQLTAQEKIELRQQLRRQQEPLKQ